MIATPFMNGLPRLLSYYGSKWRIAPKYPPPRYGTIVEPFAGGAGYALRYPDRDVILVERYHKCAAVWRFLVAAEPEEILALPLLDVGQRVDELDIPEAAQWLIGWWTNAAVTRPSPRVSRWGRERPDCSYWSELCRARIAASVPRIKHWQIIEGDFNAAPDVEATWFVDPPYQVAGRWYRHGSDRIDYAALAAWCRGRRGQVMVCEGAGAKWLPFAPFLSQVGTISNGTLRRSTASIWSNEPVSLWDFNEDNA